LALGAIGKDEERKWENERVRKWGKERREGGF